MCRTSLDDLRGDRVERRGIADTTAELEPGKSAPVRVLLIAAANQLTWNAIVVKTGLGVRLICPATLYLGHQYCLFVRTKSYCTGGAVIIVP